MHTNVLNYSLLLILILISNFYLIHGNELQEPDLLIVTVATEETDGFRRFLQSVNHYNLNLKVVGLGEKWEGGSMLGEGGGHKVNMLKRDLEEFKAEANKIILFVDSYDVVFTEGAKEILRKFKEFKANVVFSAEGFCWPKQSLSSDYPIVKMNEKRYLNSGGFIGYAPFIYDVLTHTPIENSDDDQLYYTNVFLDKVFREKTNIRLDNRNELFQNLHGALDEVQLKFKGSHSYLYNDKTGTIPVVIHGNGPIKAEFNRLTDYLYDQWTMQDGCLGCSKNLVNTSTFVSPDDYPRVVVALFIEVATPFIDDFFRHITELDYPKSKISLFVHNFVAFHDQHLLKFMETSKKSDYESITTVNHEDNVPEHQARNRAIHLSQLKNANYLFMVDSHAHVDFNESLKLLIHQNRSVLTPIMTRPGKMWANFWGAINSDGWYGRSDDYLDIINYKRNGIWNVPFANHVFLIHKFKLNALIDAWKHEDYEADMAFAFNMRDRGNFLFASNIYYYGHLMSSENYDTTRLYPDFYNMLENEWDWEQYYIHPDYRNVFKEDYKFHQPCPDVYWFPIASDAFCDQLVAIMENFGQWSGSSNEDKRLAGGYENVPTDDIHLNQVALEAQWLHLLDTYVRPVQEKIYWGYFSDPKPNAIMNFVVRYRPDKQPFLRPHHDASTYTINVALNKVNIDYEGGGCRFTRYNCSVTQTRKGWTFIHPGRFTHQHEGLHVTKGVRYIMVSFVDP